MNDDAVCLIPPVGSGPLHIGEGETAVRYDIVGGRLHVASAHVADCLARGCSPCAPTTDVADGEDVVDAADGDA